jgi:dihydroorotate dehydrogenase electron transfer subunit
MRQFSLAVSEMATIAGQTYVRCGNTEIVPVPGQVYLARAATPEQPFLRVPLYPYSTSGTGIEFCLGSFPHLYADLEPGAALDLIGPVGRGFILPPRATHVLVWCHSPARLLGLIHHALDRRFAVTLLLPADVPLPELPLEVEIQREPLTAELALWADVAALDLPDSLDQARELRALCLPRPAEFVQALITPPMPCGTGACQACWVELGHGRKLACADGPVFEL